MLTAFVTNVNKYPVERSQMEIREPFARRYIVHSTSR
jgi:hypothetical protein